MSDTRHPPTRDQERLVNGLVHLRAKIHLAARPDLHDEFFPYGSPWSELVDFVCVDLLDHSNRLEDISDLIDVQTTPDWETVRDFNVALTAMLRTAKSYSETGCMEPVFHATLKAADAVATSVVELALPLVGGKLRERGEEARAMVCNTCGGRFRSLRAGDDCPAEGCEGRVYFDVPDEEVAHV